MDTEVRVEPEIDRKRVLLIEDSSVTKDLVELVLTQSGHSVSSASTGQAGLDSLLTETFDVVLTDFHLPDFSGLEVVRRFDNARGTQARPHFIAITGDTRGLLSDAENCELFDRVIPKPLDIDIVSDLVNAPVVAPASASVATAPYDSGTSGFGLAIMNWPLGSGQAPVPGLPGIDAILVNEGRDLEALWRLSGANLLPILDRTGRLGASADVDVSEVTLDQTDNVRKRVESFHERRAELHADLTRSAEPTDRLLARIWVSGGQLDARLSHRHDGLVAWNTICDPSAIPALLSKLSAETLIDKTFFERLHICPDCESARIIVREECPACRSTHLTEESYLHHFRCATQAPESEFQRGDDLVCPKCRRELRHFGRDYDRPGILTRCKTCGESQAEPQVAFVCTRCETRTPSEVAPTRDIHSANITETGRTYLRAGGSFLGAGRQALRFGDFPLELVVALNRAAAAYNETRTPFVLVSITYEGIEEIQQRHGALRARDTRKLWLEALQQEMGDEIIVWRGSGSDYALLAGTDPNSARDRLDVARSGADITVRDNPLADLRLFGPEDIAR